MTRKQQLTYIIAGFVVISLVVLGLRWSTLAERNQINLIPVAAQAQQPTTSSKKTKDSTIPEKLSVDINSATQGELQFLPGIGPVLAMRIIEYRENHGLFVSVADLLNVPGIGPKTLKDLEQFASVGK